MNDYIRMGAPSFAAPKTIEFEQLDLAFLRANSLLTAITGESKFTIAEAKVKLEELLGCFSFKTTELQFGKGFKLSNQIKLADGYLRLFIIKIGGEIKYGVNFYKFADKTGQFQARILDLIKKSPSPELSPSWPEPVKINERTEELYSRPDRTEAPRQMRMAA